MILKNCKIVKEDRIVEADIIIDGEKIKKIGKCINENDKCIDLKDYFVFPGVIDAHVHLRWRSKKEGFYSGSLAAINGGVCFVIDMPNDNPPIINKELFYEKLKEAKKQLVNIFLNFGVTDENYKLTLREAKAYKIFMVKSVGELYIRNYSKLKEILREDKLFCIHAEHKDIIEENYKKFSLNDWSDHCKVRCKKAEIEAIKIILNNLSRAKVHFCHVSTKEGLEVLKDKPVTVEVTPHHLYLNCDMANELKGLGKVNPPLRDKEDNIALIKALNDRVDIIASDHAPHLLEEKMKDVKNCPSGIPGLETLIPMTLNLVNSGYISLYTAAKLLSYNPSRIFNIDNGIREGNYANLTIVDIKKEGKIDVDLFKSKAKFSPFEGYKVRGFPIYTIVNGKFYESYGYYL
ncbi:dihydroorotase PyrC [Methanocaldococcus villosus KIN24-T80]|uniref:Dihydroorotase n=1 Tax=Methanocaldococcus villosus KIN24-T80 TaxID=1069083 RepID=N6VSA3_9EURY|nr:dihydroorotase [Methanocaldococcus villosus]ENN96755.1 dihydroorotase PyrC [Methanocaldococcus villosus KIN24-T80]